MIMLLPTLSALCPGASRSPLAVPGAIRARPIMPLQLTGPYWALLPRSELSRRSVDVHMDASVEPPASSEPQSRELPAWVDTLNASLEKSALSTLLAYLLIDVGFTLSILALLVGFRIPIAADFAIALALVKAVRGPRLALDASLAAVLTRWFPSLKAVKVTRCFDEFAASLSVVRQSFQQGLDEGRTRSVSSTRDGATTTASSSEPSSQPRGDKLATATRAARTFASDYGLAYMAAKNLLALLQMVILLAALRSGGPAKAATATLLRTLKVSPKAGMLAGQLALAVTIHYAFFPLVVIGAAKLGPRIPSASSPRVSKVVANLDL